MAFVHEGSMIHSIEVKGVPVFSSLPAENMLGSNPLPHGKARQAEVRKYFGPQCEFLSM